MSHTLEALQDIVYSMVGVVSNIIEEGADVEFLDAEGEVIDLIDDEDDSIINISEHAQYLLQQVANLVEGV
jgi:hypothetical protein